MKIVQFDEAKLLSLFYDPETIHTPLVAPFVHGNYVCATETHVMIKMEKDQLGGDYETRPGTPNIDRIMPKQTCEVIYLRSELEKAYQPLCTEDEQVEIATAVKCEECNGLGYVEWKYYSDRLRKYFYGQHECPCCDGDGELVAAKYHNTGKKLPPYNAVIKIKGVPFQAWIIGTLLDAMDILGIDRITLAHSEKGRPNLFILAAGIEVVAMPMYIPDGDEDDYVITKL